MASRERTACGRDSIIEPGWEDALEAVLRERLEAIELERLDAVTSWTGGVPPGRMAVYAPGTAGPTTSAPNDALLGKVRAARPDVERLLADWLAASVAATASPRRSRTVAASARANPSSRRRDTWSLRRR